MNPTNEPKMPEVIYVDVNDDYPGPLLASKLPQEGCVPYYHDDKVQELKEALRDCLIAMKAIRIATRSIVEQEPPAMQLALSKDADNKVEQALTKVSNLLK